MYMNQVYFGEGCYGIHAAADRFYDKEPKDLTVVESATLVGLVRFPQYSSPRRYSDVCKQNRNRVLDGMTELGYIDNQTMAAATRAPVKVKPNTESSLN